MFVISANSLFQHNKPIQIACSEMKTIHINIHHSPIFAGLQVTLHSKPTNRTALALQSILKHTQKFARIKERSIFSVALSHLSVTVSRSVVSDVARCVDATGPRYGAQTTEVQSYGYARSCCY